MVLVYQPKSEKNNKATLGKPDLSKIYLILKNKMLSNDRISYAYRTYL